MARRQRQSTQRALALLGPERLLRFLRAADGTAAPYAVRLLLDRVERGATIDEVLFASDGAEWILEVTPVASGQFRVAFGCLAGPLAGDGGEWLVHFSDSGEVAAISGGETWIS